MSRAPTSSQAGQKLRATPARLVASATWLGVSGSLVRALIAIFALGCATAASAETTNRKRPSSDQTKLL
jgi:hypothetical protein